MAAALLTKDVALAEGYSEKLLKLNVGGKTNPTALIANRPSLDEGPEQHAPGQEGRVRKRDSKASIAEGGTTEHKKGRSDGPAFQLRATHSGAVFNACDIRATNIKVRAT